jgi:CheY-like chemotaxis protein
VNVVDRNTLRIVIADDNRDAAMALAMLLDRFGFQVIDTVFDGDSALACIRANRPQVAILDIAMPEMDGYEVARQVREEIAAPPRLVAITALGRGSDHEDAMQAGFDAHFTKPVRGSELVVLLEEYLAGTGRP